MWPRPGKGKWDPIRSDRPAIAFSTSARLVSIETSGRISKDEIQAVRAQEVEVAFTGDDPGGMIEVAARIGEIPLPPYIKRPGGPTPDEPNNLIGPHLIEA